MSNTWITDIRHFLDEKGNLSAELTPSARNLATHQGTIISLITAAKEPWKEQTINIQCRRRPKRKQCPGVIHAIFDFEESKIFWRCPVCGDNGIITGWFDTIFDCFTDEYDG